MEAYFVSLRPCDSFQLPSWPDSIFCVNRLRILMASTPHARWTYYVSHSATRKQCLYYKIYALYITRYKFNIITTYCKTTPLENLWWWWSQPSIDAFTGFASIPPPPASSCFSCHTNTTKPRRLGKSHEKPSNYNVLYVQIDMRGRSTSPINMKKESWTFEGASSHKLATHGSKSADSNIIKGDDDDDEYLGLLLQPVERPLEPIEVDRPIHCPSPQVAPRNW